MGDACKSHPYTSRLEQIGIPTLEYSRAVSDMVEVYNTNIYTSMTRGLFRGGLIYEIDLVETTAMSWRGSSQRTAYVVPKQTLSTFGV